MLDLLTFEQKQLIEVLKQIENGKREFKPENETLESLKEFQSIARCLEKAKSLGYIDIKPPRISRKVKTFGFVTDIIVTSSVSFDGTQAIKYPEKLLTDSYPQARIDMSTTINQHISGTVYGSVLAAETITNCLNTVQTSQTGTEIKELLTLLLKEIERLNQQKLPAKKVEKVEEMSREAKSLVDEVNSKQPRKKYAALSLDGIKEAAIALGETAKPILELAEKISPFLQVFI